MTSCGTEFARYTGILAESFAQKAESFAQMAESFTRMAESFALKAESFTLKAESFTRMAESFALKQESFTLKAEAFTLKPEPETGDFVFKTLKYAIVVTYETLLNLVLSLPRYRTFNAFKSFVLRRIGAKVGRRVVFYPGVWIMTGRNLVLEDDVDLAKDVLVTTDGGVRIGARTLIGYRTQILSGNHVIPPRGERIFDAGHDNKSVEIANDVWIGANCVILPGVTIGEGAVIAAGAVVTKNIPAWSIAGGVPAKVLREREEAS